MQVEKKITTVAVVGAGAMGSAYASMFSDAGSFSPFFLAEGQRYHRLENRELQVNGRNYTIQARQPWEVSQPADLILVALKHHHLDEALPAIKAVTGPDTIILSVMNGLESEEIIGRACGMSNVLPAIAVGIDALREGDRFSYAQPGRIIFGQRDGSSTERLREALSRAGIPHEIPADMVRTMWWKFMINVGINQASAVLRAPYGVFQESPDARSLLLLLMQEVIELAGKISVDLTSEDLDKWFSVLDTLAPQGKTSMLQDIEAGRKTEVEIFAGKVVAMGEKHGVATPVNQTILNIIRVIEKQAGVPQKYK
ncbi:ketopantoate reductase family protein [Desulfopila inferna]|uniref:ketopantoate reductase family protein n=1 Tax=Desulfopila inferna TaxID=468528 RepID=UPI0019634486|nr:2-dehydropantoate 2-reductase [Desulfopila inferna]MBM9604946.1 2-dehydropantoate 2-reductase [Desulfopila inferna]